jgi:hypothetical protein
MVLKVVRVISLAAMGSLGACLMYIMFIGENKCVCLIFIFILTVDIVRAIRLALNRKMKKKVEVKDYLIGLKWISFIVLAMLILGSFFYNIVRMWSISNKFGLDKNQWFTILEWMDYFLLFFEKNDIIPRSVHKFNPECH